MEFFAATLKISACSFSLLGRLVYNEALLPDNNVFVISFQILLFALVSVIQNLNTCT